jgi:hypothetical protein
MNARRSRRSVARNILRKAPVPISTAIAAIADIFQEGTIMAKGLILWLLGVPGLLIIALLVFGIL